MILNIFGVILKKFVEPIRSRPKLIVIVTMIVFLPTMGAEVMLTKLVQRNADDSLMLKCEAKEESGKDFIIAREDHVYLLERYLGHMKKRFLSRLLKLLYPELSPEKQLTPVLQNLREGVCGQEKARKKIQEAAEAFEQFIRNSEKSSDIPILTFKTEVVSEELLKELKEALDKSREEVDLYNKDPNVHNAEKTCRANRRAIGLVYLVRFGYQNFIQKETVEQFQKDINMTISCNNELQRSDDVTAEDKQSLRKYTKSEHRRIGILQAIKANDMYTARKLLRTAVEEQ